MARYTSDDLGGVNDDVTLKLGGEELLIAETYDVRMSFFRQPSVFALRTGWGGTVLDLLVKYPPNTPFELYVAGRLQFTGRIDEIEVEQSAGASEVTFKGRDDLAPLHDAYALADRSFQNASYEEVVSQCMLAAGMSNFVLSFDPDINRNRRAGVQVNVAASGGRKVFGRTAGTSKKQNAGQLKFGDKLYEFVKKELDRAGLYLFAAADNNFILAEPHADQAPTYRILGQRGAQRNKTNIKARHYRESTTRRYAEAIVAGRGGGDKAGQQPVRGSYVDREMTEVFGYPSTRVLSMRDDKCSSQAQADLLARKMIADSRRDGHSLSYTLSGHTVPALNGRSERDLAVWTIDTVVHVTDDELGLDLPMWISDVTFRRAPQTETEITLVRPDDLVQGSGGE